MTYYWLKNRKEIIECNTSENNVNIFLCHICNKEYNIFFHLKQHIRKVHEEKKTPNFQSKTIQPFDENEIAANKDDDLIPTAQYLNTNHEIQQDHKCISCSKSFAQVGSFEMHMHLNHEGQKDYKCESCGKSFSRAYNLKKHINKIQTHTLKQHIHNIHGGHKDFKCESCGKYFALAGNLKKHSKTIHEKVKE